MIILDYKSLDEKESDLASDEKTSPEREVMYQIFQSGLLWQHPFQDGFDGDGVTAAPPGFIKITIALHSAIDQIHLVGIVVPCDGRLKGLELDPFRFFSNIPFRFFQLSNQTCIHPTLL
jgi:hypothetical protein